MKYGDMKILKKLRWAIYSERGLALWMNRNLRLNNFWMISNRISSSSSGLLCCFYVVACLVSDVLLFTKCLFGAVVAWYLKFPHELGTQFCEAKKTAHFDFKSCLRCAECVCVSCVEYEKKRVIVRVCVCWFCFFVNIRLFTSIQFGHLRMNIFLCIFHTHPLRCFLILSFFSSFVWPVHYCRVCVCVFDKRGEKIPHFFLLSGSITSG